MKTWRSFLALMAAGSVAAGCTKAQGTETRPPRPVRAQALAPVAPETAVRYSATIEAAEQVPLAFKSSGYVDWILRRPGADGRPRTAQAGDLVTKGSVLARVRESEYREQLNRGRARVAEAEAGLEKARLDLERARTLFAAESLTKPDLDAAQAAFDTGQARLAGSRAEAELAATSLNEAALVSPASGILLERRIEVGTLVGVGTVAFLIGDISAVKARFGVPDGMVPSMKLGEPIDLVVEAFAGARFEGRVTAIAPAADPQSRVFDVEVTIPNGDRRLRPGMIGTVAVHQSAAAAAAAAAPLLTVPLTAIVRPTAGGPYAAFVLERQGNADVARLRHVELGEVIGNGIVILEGVRPGERVIVTGATLLVDGEPVRVIP